MIDKIVFASNNKHKIKEVKEMFPNIQILSLSDIGFFDEIDENGNTFLENALIKVNAVSQFMKAKGIVAPIMADDSGLCVDALNGAPGVHSARYAGQHDDRANRAKLLKELDGKKNRNAHFACAIVMKLPDGRVISSEGKTFGKITTEEIGDNSFGFDCLFFSDELGKTFGVASDEEKNKVSHRGKAIAALKEKIIL